MSQIPLVRPVRAPEQPGIDLRCCDVAALLEKMVAGGVRADLVVADPPWLYDREIGGKLPSDYYDGLPVPEIVAHVAVAGTVADDARLALWLTWPKMAEWEGCVAGAAWPWGAVVTGGAWTKSEGGDAGHYGQGYHWAGCSEPVFVYRRGRPITDRAAKLRNAWIEPAGHGDNRRSLHSRKPVGWQRQWLRRWTPVGGLVLDLYAGLGSVAEACLLEGRRYIGAEIDPERHAAAMSLLAQVRQGD